MNPQAFEGELASNVDVFGQTVDVWFRPRFAEVERRETLGVGAIVDHDGVRALMDMPEGFPLDVMALDPATLMAIDALATVGAGRFHREFGLSARGSPSRTSRLLQDRRSLVRRSGNHPATDPRPAHRLRFIALGSANSPGDRSSGWRRSYRTERMAHGSGAGHAGGASELATMGNC